MKITTINLYQFCNPNYSYYTKKEKYTLDEWNKKLKWLSETLISLNSDIVVFQEVFTHEDLKDICIKNGLKYFQIIDKAKLNKNTFETCVVALASKYPINEILNVEFQSDFQYARKPLKLKINIENNEVIVYAVHLKSNRLNEFEHKFTINSSYKDKYEKNINALKNKSSALYQRFNEVRYLSNDINQTLKTYKNIVIAGDFNDKLYSFCLEILKSNEYLNDILNSDGNLKENYEPQLYDAYDLYSNYDYKNRKYTSYFMSMGNIIDFILVSKNLKNILSYEVKDEHLKDNKNGSLLNSDHAIVSCEIKLK